MQTITTPKLTIDTVKSSPFAECECGGKVFSEKTMFKLISAILSPTGNQEAIPIPVFVCDKCGKIQSIFDQQNLVPNELKTSKLINK